MILQKSKTVDFDPSSKLHRASVVAFMRRNAWVDSPLRFTDDPEYGSVPEQVQTKLLRWYMDKETVKKSVMKPQQPSIKINLSYREKNHE